MTSQPSLFFDEALVELNPSRLQSWLDCPKQYEFRYVERRPERRSSPQAAFGRSVHNALRDFYALSPSLRTRDNLQSCMRHAWDPSGYPTRQAAENARKRAVAMMDAYFESADHAAVRVIALESKFATHRPDMGVLVWGRIDRLDLDGEGYTVVDYKTGRYGSEPGEVEDSLPLSLYAMAVCTAMGADECRIALVRLSDSEVIWTTRSAERLDRDWQRLSEVADQIKSGDFPAQPGGLCRYCDFLEVCTAGQQHLGTDLKVRRIQ